MSTRTTLKTYFQSGDQPTEAQFGELIDGLASTSSSNSLISNIDFATGSVGISYTTTSTGSIDSQTIAVDGKKVTFQTQLQAALLATSSTTSWTINNSKVENNSVVWGSIIGETAGDITASMISTFVTQSGESFKFNLFNPSGVDIADDTGFTASFAIL